jgi:hypothetical protein
MRCETTMHGFRASLSATAGQRAAVEISPMGLHWDELDEDISIEELIAGRADQTIKRPSAA